MRRARILLADDDTLVVQGFQKLLESTFELVGIVTDGRSLLDSAVRLRPEVIVLDISMPGLNGIDAARKLKKALPNVKLVFLTVHAKTAYVNEAFRIGASAYLIKRSAASELIFAIKEALEGRHYLTTHVTKGLMDSVLGHSRDLPSKMFSGKLTDRQREVLQLVAEGRTAKEIAGLLDISVRTVEYHKTGIMRALNLRSTAELTKYAVEEGITAL
ncbi:MAG: response regulator transcription factor [Acidobacteriota bacterium]